MYGQKQGWNVTELDWQDGDGAGIQVDAGQCAVHGTHPVKGAEPVERNPVGPCPLIGPGKPPPQFLAAHQGGLGRDADDIELSGQPDGGEHTAVPEPSNNDTFSAHAIL